MSNNNNSKIETKNPKDSIALLVGGLFILSLVFASYNYFNRDKNEDNLLSSSVESEMENNKNEGDLNGNGTTDKRDENVAGAQDNTINAQWVATDYKQGDITGGTYTVKTGDTLWEIAEAVYGNGAEWTKILEANSSSIGQLPNGQQALISPNQVLLIP